MANERGSKTKQGKKHLGSTRSVISGGASKGRDQRPIFARSEHRCCRRPGLLYPAHRGLYLSIVSLDVESASENRYRPPKTGMHPIFSFFFSLRILWRDSHTAAASLIAHCNKVVWRRDGDGA